MSIYALRIWTHYTANKVVFIFEFLHSSFGIGDHILRFTANWRRTLTRHTTNHNFIGVRALWFITEDPTIFHTDNEYIEVCLILNTGILQMVERASEVDNYSAERIAMYNSTPKVSDWLNDVIPTKTRFWYIRHILSEPSVCWVLWVYRAYM